MTATNRQGRTKISFLTSRHARAAHGGFDPAKATGVGLDRLLLGHWHDRAVKTER